MKTIAKCISVLYSLILLSACGGSLTNLAQDTLYPFADVNKAYPVPATAPEGLTSFDLTTLSSENKEMAINGWLYRNPNPQVHKVIVYFHGNGENLQALAVSGFLSKMTELGANFFVIDYPGLGRSTGEPNEYNLVASAVKAIDWVREKFPKSQIEVWGRSLGASVATLAAEKRQEIIDHLMLTSPWFTFMDLARETTKLIDSVDKKWLDKNKWDSASSAAKIHVKTLIHHGLEDKLIPIKFGRSLFNKFPEPNLTYMVEIPKVGHNDIFSKQILWDDIKEFIH